MIFKIIYYFQINSNNIDDNNNKNIILLYCVNGVVIAALMHCDHFLDLLCSSEFRYY